MIPGVFAAGARNVQAGIIGTIHGGANGETYQVVLSASGVPAPVTWSVAGGSLPAGVSIVQDGTTTAELYGVPDDMPGYYPVRVRAEGVSGTYAELDIEIPLGSYSALLHFDGPDGSDEITDQTGKPWTAFGQAQIDTSESVFGGGSLLLDGNGDYLTSPNNSDFVFGDEDFTLHMWARPTVAGGVSAWNSLMGQAQNINSNNNRWYWHASQGYIGFGWDPPSSATPISSLYVIPAGWSHLALIRKGDQFSFYENGLLKASGTRAGEVYQVAGSLYVGVARYSGAPRYFTGNLEEVSFVRGAALWGDEFDPPDAPSDFPQPASVLAVNGSLPPAISGVPYSSTTNILIHGAGAPFVVSVIDGTLPGGWTASVNGNHVEVTGPGVSAGVYTFTLEVEDDDSNTVELPLTIKVE